MLAGTNPFRGETLAEIIKKQVLTEPPPLQTLADVPDDLARMVHKGLCKSPDARFQTACEMNQALKSLGQPVQESAGSLTQFLSSVELGAISMDDAVIAREKVKEAIDKGFKRQLTIVMLDLAGSSKIKIPNQTLIADRAFQDYRQTINRILEEHGVERYEWSGDGAISLFPEPIGAVDAAVKVQRTVAEVGGRHNELPDALKVRIGIRTGMVYYDPRRTLGEFASRTVDQAGHLEKDCPPGLIRLGYTTVKAIGERYQTTLIGKNRDDIEVFEIGLEALHGAGAQTPAPPRPEPVRPSTPPIVDEPVPPRAVESETVDPADEDDDAVWWGWRSIGLLFFLFTSIKVIERLGLDIPNGPVRLISVLLAAHVGLIPIYCIVQLFRNREDLAKEAAVACGVFLAGMVGVALIVQNI
jgi:class 3 adenylate cyclase